MRLKRIDQVESYILEHKTASIDNLCDEFQISKNTIRRDLDVLTKKGTIAKVYGGVIAIEKAGPNIRGLTSFDERNIVNREAKNKIARVAAKYIEDGDTIFIDTGTSTLNIIDYLSHVNKLTIITNSVQVIYKALAYPNIDVIGLPGILKRDTASLVGNGCAQHLKKYNIGKAFMACTAISLDNGVSNATTEEYDIKKIAIEKSLEHYLLVDQSKFNKTSLMTFCQLSMLDCIITDMTPNDEYISYFRDNNIRLDVASDITIVK